MKWSHLALLFAIFAVLLSGCGEQPAEPGEGDLPEAPSPDPADRVSAPDRAVPSPHQLLQELSTGADGLQGELGTYVDQTLRELSTLETQMQQLAARAEEKGDDARATLKKSMADWDAKFSEISAKVERLFIVGDTAVTDLKKSIDASVEELTESLEPAMENLQ